IWGINFDLPQVYTTEEYKVVNYALKMGSTKDLNPHFFNYPSLYLYFTLFVSGLYFAIGKFLGVFNSARDFAYSFIKDPTPIYLIMRLFSVLWSTGASIMVYLIGKEIFNKRIGFIASLMFVFVPSILVSSHEIRPNMPSLFFVLLSFYFIYKFYKTGENRYLFFSSVSAGIAISIFYNAIMLILLLPVVYFFRYKQLKLFNGKLWLSLFLIFIFFIIGTPFAILDYKSFIHDFFAHSHGALINIPNGILGVIKNFIFVGSEFSKTPFLGILCFIGTFFILFERELENFILLFGIILFSIPVMMYHAPGIGYMFPAFPFFILAGAKLVDKLLQTKYKTLTFLIYFGCLIPTIKECIYLDYLYTLKDNRTTAKEWIEKNIPFGSKILIDMYPHSPPLKETKEQLERLYKRAVELNHYKKEYLKFQLDVHPGGNYGYEIYRILRLPEEVSGTVELVKEAQKVQDLVDISNDGFSILKNKGIDYIILNSKDRESALNSKYEFLKNFYKLVPEKCKLIKKFPEEKIKFQKGPEIFIYKIL
ncbi:MAG: ArnT family glycosyltransferase, partial [Endomicrobiia bacterium]